MFLLHKELFHTTVVLKTILLSQLSLIMLVHALYFPIWAMTKVFKIIRPVTQVGMYRGLYRYLDLVDWDFVGESLQQDLDNAFLSLTIEYYALISFPVKTVSAKRYKSVQWFTPELRIIMRDKLQFMNELFINTNCDEIRQARCSLRNLYHKAIMKAKIAANDDLIGHSKNSARRM